MKYRWSEGLWPLSVVVVVMMLPDVADDRIPPFSMHRSKAWLHLVSAVLWTQERNGFQEGWGV